MRLIRRNRYPNRPVIVAHPIIRNQIYIAKSRVVHEGDRMHAASMVKINQKHSAALRNVLQHCHLFLAEGIRKNHNLHILLHLLPHSLKDRKR